MVLHRVSFALENRESRTACHVSCVGAAPSVLIPVRRETFYDASQACQINSIERIFHDVTGRKINEAERRILSAQAKLSSEVHQSTFRIQPSAGFASTEPRQSKAWLTEVGDCGTFFWRGSFEFEAVPAGHGPGEA